MKEKNIEPIDSAKYLLYEKIADAALGGLDLNDEVIHGRFLKLMDKLQKRIQREFSNSKPAVLICPKTENSSYVVGNSGGRPLVNGGSKKGKIKIPIKDRPNLFVDNGAQGNSEDNK